MNSTLSLTDPCFTKPPTANLLRRAALRLILDERDVPFIRLTLILLTVFVPSALYFLSHADFSIWLALAYLLVNFLAFIGPYTLMLHNISHRPLFKKEYRWMKPAMLWLLGPLFGQTPETYFAHHIGMHHFENNLKDDLSSTLRFQRDSILDFGRYVGRFLTVGVLELVFYLKRRRRNKLMRQIMLGEGIYFLGLAAMLYLNWRGSLVVFVIPLVTIRFLMMTGNWAQHAFIDKNDQANNFRNSITCINSTYNRLCFNDGYHIGHHIKMNRHWTEMPGDFLDNLEKYKTEKAIVFKKLDYFMIWLLLMLKRFDKLADFYVDLGDVKMTKPEIIELLKTRVQRIAI